MESHSNQYWQPTVEDLLELQEQQREEENTRAQMGTQNRHGTASSVASDVSGVPSKHSAASDSYNGSTLVNKAAEGGNIFRGSMLSTNEEQVDQGDLAVDNYSTSQISNASIESFDWLGDDRSIDEDEQEELIFAELAAPPPQKPPEPSVLTWLIPKKAADYLLILIFFLSIIITIIKVVFPSFLMPEINGVGVHKWMGIIFAIMFIPTWSYVGLGKVVRYLKATAVFSKTDHPGHLEAIQAPAALCISTVIVGLLWITYFPSSCHPGTMEIKKAMDTTGASQTTVALLKKKILTMEVSEIFCLFGLMRRLLLFFFVVGAMYALQILAMRTIRNTFQESNFKNRIIENRFKVFVAEQLLFASKEEKFMRAIQSPDSLSSHLRLQRENERKGNALSEFLKNMPYIVISKLFYQLRWKRTTTVTRGPVIHSPSSREFAPSGETPSVSSSLLRLTTNNHRDRLNSLSIPNEDFSHFRKDMLVRIRTAGYESTVKEHLPRDDGQAKLMARSIFHYLCPARRNYLKYRDFAAIIPNTLACRDAYNIFDLDKDGTITKAEFRSAMVRIFREQVNLTQSIANTGSALSILDSIASWMVTIGLFLLFLGIFGVNVQSIFTISASVILGLNFIIFDGANKTFHAIIFLFVMHPYDVGDRIVIGKDTGYAEEDILTVVHINIQTTVFRRWNGLEVSVPNHVLANGPVTNLSRCKEQWERVEFTLQTADMKGLTVEEETKELAALRKAIEGFLQQNSSDYYQAFELKAVIAADAAKSDKNLDTIKFILKIRCKETGDSQKKWIRHSRILVFVKQATSSVIGPVAV